MRARQKALFLLPTNFAYACKSKTKGVKLLNKEMPMTKEQFEFAGIYGEDNEAAEAQVNKIDLTSTITTEKLSEIPEHFDIPKYWPGRNVVRPTPATPKTLDKDFIWQHSDDVIEIYSLTTGEQQELQLSEYCDVSKLTKVELSKSHRIAMSFSDTHELTIFDGSVRPSHRYSIDASNPQFGFLDNGKLAYIDRERQVRVNGSGDRFNISSKPRNLYSDIRKHGSIAHRLHAAGNMIMFEDSFLDTHHERRRGRGGWYLGFSQEQVDRMEGKWFINNLTVVECANNIGSLVTRMYDGGRLEEERARPFAEQPFFLNGDLRPHMVRPGEHEPILQSNASVVHVQQSRKLSLADPTWMNVFNANKHGIQGAYKLRESANVESITSSDDGSYLLAGGCEGKVYLLPLLEPDKVGPINAERRNAAWKEKRPTTSRKGKPATSQVLHFESEIVGDPSPEKTPPQAEISLQIGKSAIIKILPSSKDEYLAINENREVHRFRIDQKEITKALQESEIQ